MSRPKRCKICTGDDLTISTQVNALLESGARLKFIAEQVPGFSIFQLSRHKNNCLGPRATSEISPESGSAEIAKWLQRAEDTYLTAQVNGDVKSAASAISTAVRTLTALEKQLQTEKTEANTGVDNPNRPATIADLNKLTTDYLEQRDSESGGVLQKAQSLWLEEPAFSTLVLRIWKNRSILPALIATCDLKEEHVNN